MSSKTKTTATKEEARPALVPKLRFPEFRGAEGWSEEKLDDLVHFQDGFAFKSTAFVKASEDATQVIRITDINNKNTNEDNVYIPTAFLEHNKLGKYSVEDGDLLLSLTGAAGFNFFFWNGGPATINQRTAKVTSKRKDGHALLRLLEPLIHEKLNERGEGQNNNLSKEFLNTIVLLVPEPAEQQKIAECLSSVDELMAAQARKVDALKTHKKGLMQQLFPREGETQPRLRFPEFQNAGEWSEGRIADIATVLQGYGFPERHQGKTSGDYPFYKVSDISRSLAAGKVFIEESANYINKGLLKELRAKPIPEGTTIFAKIGEAIRSNKRAITTVPCLIDNNAAGVKRIKGKATDLFIYLLMEQISLIDHAGGVVPAVNKSAIEEIPVKYPEPDEQERIASCMSSLDALITAETQKLESLKTHKKGLMQQLFPSPVEVEA